MQEKRFTVSNLLSVSRILLIIPAGYCLITEFSHHRWWAAVIVLLAVSTDFLDGFFARKLHQVTELGKFIDPLADKFAVGFYALLLLWTGDVPLWFVAFVLVRDLLIFLGGVYIKSQKGIIPQSNWPGKIAVNFIAVVFFLGTIRMESLELVRTIAVWGSVVMMTWSSVSYAQRLFIGRNAGI
jgi:CDP-diacylglycerol--glycerol-3-phosphate 3-phosphatidyltransferase